MLDALKAHPGYRRRGIAAQLTDRRLGGLGIHEEGRLESMLVERLPLPLRAANAVLRVVPRDGRMRNLIIDKAWFAPGRLDAAR